MKKRKLLKRLKRIQAQLDMQDMMQEIHQCHHRDIAKRVTSVERAIGALYRRWEEHLNPGCPQEEITADVAGTTSTTPMPGCTTETTNPSE